MPTKVRLYPVECAWCKNDIPGSVSEVPHSSGICPACITEHFPELALDSHGETADIVGTPPAKGTHR
jgi:hypothetical protein